MKLLSRKRLYNLINALHSIRPHITDIYNSHTSRYIMTVRHLTVGCCSVLLQTNIFYSFGINTAHFPLCTSILQHSLCWIIWMPSSQMNADRKLIKSSFITPAKKRTYNIWGEIYHKRNHNWTVRTQSWSLLGEQCQRWLLVYKYGRRRGYGNV